MKSIVKKIVDKNPFAGGRKVAVLALWVCVLGSSCQNRNEADLPEQLYVEDISFNLSESGKTDPALLIGEWDALKFAYTADGHKISDVVKIKNALLDIQAAPTSSVCEAYDPETGMQSPRWVLHSTYNGGSWLCSLSGNLINLTFCGSTKVYVPNPHEENDIVWALDNVYCFVIKGNELMIFFTGDEEDKNFTSIAGNKRINLIIFKKR